MEEIYTSAKTLKDAEKDMIAALKMKMSSIFFADGKGRQEGDNSIMIRKRKRIKVL